MEEGLVRVNDEEDKRLVLCEEAVKTRREAREKCSFSWDYPRGLSLHDNQGNNMHRVEALVLRDV